MAAVAGAGLGLAEQPSVTVQPVVTSSPMGARLTLAVTFQRHHRAAAASLVRRLAGLLLVRAAEACALSIGSETDKHKSRAALIYQLNRTGAFAILCTTKQRLR